jgi:hypothetical protein
VTFADVGDWLLDPALVVAFWLPLAAAALATLIARLSGGRGATLASAAVGVGFVVAYASILHIWGVPAPLAEHKPLYLALLGLVLGCVFDTEALAGRYRRPLVVVLGLVAVLWVAGPALFDSRPGPERNLVLAYLLAAAVVLLRTTHVAGSALTPPLQVFVAGLGVAALAATADAHPFAQLGLGLAAAALGFLGWNWPTVRFIPGNALALGAGLPLLALSGEVVLYEDGNPWALGLLLLVFFSEWLTGRLGLGGKGKALRPLAQAFTCLLVIGGATVLARWQAGLPLPLFG